MGPLRFWFSVLLLNLINFCSICYFHYKNMLPMPPERSSKPQDQIKHAQRSAVLNLSFPSPLMPTVKGTKLLTAGINLPRIIENIPYLRTICLLFLIFFSLDLANFDFSRCRPKIRPR